MSAISIVILGENDGKMKTVGLYKMQINNSVKSIKILSTLLYNK